MFRLTRSLRCAASDVKNRLYFSLSAPGESLINKSVIESVTIPGQEGYATWSNGHSQSVTQLRPGVVTVRANGVVSEYFVSDGFAYFEKPTDESNCCTASVTSSEIVPVEALDKERIAATLSELLSAPRTTAWDNSRVLLGQELLGAALNAAK